MSRAKVFRWQDCALLRLAGLLHANARVSRRRRAFMLHLRNRLNELWWQHAEQGDVRWVSRATPSHPTRVDLIIFRRRFGVGNVTLCPLCDKACSYQVVSRTRRVIYQPDLIIHCVLILSEAPRLVSLRAINVSVRQSRDRFLRHLHEPLGNDVLGALEAETIDDCVGVGPSQRNLRHKFSPRLAPPPHFQITFYL